MPSRPFRSHFRQLVWLPLLATAVVQADSPSSLTHSPATPALIEVANLGGDPAAPYYRAAGLPDAPMLLHPASVNLPTPPTQPLDGSSWLPVRSSLLTPGRVEPRPLEMPGLQPLFLVGDDARSRRWLQERSEQLRRLGAVGLVVNVESAEALAELRQLAAGLRLRPVPGNDLARRLQLEHYPMLITATSLEQ